MWLKWLVSSSLTTRIRLRSCHGRQRLPELFQRLPYAAHRANWQTAAERVWQWCLELLTAVARYAELLLSKAHVRRDTSCAQNARNATSPNSTKCPLHTILKKYQLFKIFPSDHYTISGGSTFVLLFVFFFAKLGPQCVHFGFNLGLCNTNINSRYFLPVTANCKRQSVFLVQSYLAYSLTVDWSLQSM